MQYIPVPDDPLLLNSVCPICQEKFKQVYLDEEWAWEDATRVGDRIYHASCHQEATGSSLPVLTKSRGTPEPVLGKRKAEVSPNRTYEPPDPVMYLLMLTRVQAGRAHGPERQKTHGCLVAM